MENKKEFEFQNLIYRDTRYDFDIKLQGTGKFYYESPEPLPGSDNENSEALMAELPNVLSAAFLQIGERGIAYNRLPYETALLTSVMRELLEGPWKQTKGIELKQIFFTGLCPYEESIIKIIAANKAAPPPTAEATNTGSFRNICRSCGADMTDRGSGVRFCAECGAKMDGGQQPSYTAPPRIICGSCGTDLTGRGSDIRFCAICGAGIQSNRQ